MAFPMGLPKHVPLRCGHQGLPCGEEEDAPAVASTGGEVLRLPGKTLERDVENPLKTHGKPMGFLEFHGVFGFWNMIPTFVIMKGGFSTFNIYNYMVARNIIPSPVHPRNHLSKHGWTCLFRHE